MKVKVLAPKVKEVSTSIPHASSLEDEVSDESFTTGFDVVDMPAPLIRGTSSEQDAPGETGRVAETDTAPVPRQVYAATHQDSEMKYQLNTLHSQRTQTATLLNRSGEPPLARPVFQNPDLIREDSNREEDYQTQVKAEDVHVKRRYPWEA